MTATSAIAIYSLSSAGILLLAEEALSANQNYTLIGLLAVVFLGMGKAAHWIATRFMSSMDRQTDKVATSLEQLGANVAANTGAVNSLVQMMRDWMHRDDERAKRLEEAIEEIPEQVKSKRNA